MFKPITLKGKLFRSYLRVPKHPAKIRLQNYLGSHFFSDGIDIATESGSVFSLNPNDWITRVILLENSYEKGSLALASRILSTGGVFIDVGANFGLYSCELSAKDTVKVVAIEPNYMVLPRLLKNIRLNKRENVTVLNTALGETFGFASSELPQKNNLGSASFATGNNSSFGILGCSLAYVFESQNLKGAELIKLDIEGNEFAVLRHFPFEKYHVKNILLEHNRLSRRNFACVQSFFTQKGFAIKNIFGQPYDDETVDLPENNLWLVNQNN